jgi:hypothetical protein
VNSPGDPGLSDEARRLISDARGFDDPGPDDRERVKARWIASIAAGAGLSVLGAAARAGGGAGWGLKAAGLVVALAAGGAGLYTLLPSAVDSNAEKPRATPVKPAPAAPAIEAPSTVPGPVDAPAVVEPVAAAPTLPEPAGAKPSPSPSPAPPVVAARAPARTPVTAPTPVPVTSPNGQLGEETAMLRQIRRSIQDGEGQKALGLLDEYQRRFGSPVLAMEAAGLRVDALCRMGDKAAANAAAGAFQKAWPASPLRVACP